MEKRFSGKVGLEYGLALKSRPHFERLQRKIAEFIYRNSNAKFNALEVGGGYGYTTFYVLKRNSHLKVISLDNERKMIKQSKIFLKDYIAAKRVKLVYSDALKFLKKTNSNTFDIFFSGFTLHNIEKHERKEILKEIYRVLKNRGLFINGDKYANNNRKIHARDLNWQLKQFEVYDKIRRSDLKKEWTNHYLRDEEPDLLMKEGEAKSQMKQIGFKKIRIIFRKHMDLILVAEK